MLRDGLELQRYWDRHISASKKVGFDERTVFLQEFKSKMTFLLDRERTAKFEYLTLAH